MKTISARAACSRVPALIERTELAYQLFERIRPAAVGDGCLDAAAGQRPGERCADGARSNDADGHVMFLSGLRLRAAGSNALLPRGPSAELLHEGEEIGHSPVFGDLAVTHPHDVDRLELNLAASWRHAQEFSPVRAVISLVRRHAVAIGELPMDLGMKVGECGSAGFYRVVARRSYRACGPAAACGRENRRRRVRRTVRNFRRLALPRCCGERLPSLRRLKSCSS